MSDEERKTRIDAKAREIANKYLKKPTPQELSLLRTCILAGYMMGLDESVVIIKENGNARGT